MIYKHFIIVRGLNLTCALLNICHLAIPMVGINFLSKRKTIATKKLEQNDTEVLKRTMFPTVWKNILA